MKKMIFLLIALVLFIGLNYAEKATAKDRQVINTPDAPAAIGAYSQAIRAGNMLFLSGQLGISPKTGKFVEGGFEGQARQALENQKAILKAAGFSLSDVVQCQVFVSDMKNYRKFNAIYKEYFTKDFPARAVLEVSRIPGGGLVEIMMVAVKKK